MTDRKFLGKPLDEVALMYNAVELSADQFVDEMRDALLGFAANMKTLPMMKDRLMFAEQWMETFLAWAEFNTTDE